jgi:tape measure domain-containing protein
MSGVDSRIVTMKFDNAQFEKNASTTMSTLDKLKASLNFSGAEKGLSDLQGTADKFHMDSMDGAVQGVSKSFIALGTIAVTALANITNKVIDTGKQMFTSMSGVQAMADGFSDYELKIGATQTIMAGTGENIGTVTKYLKELDVYADKTIYSLSDMTSNIGKFTNAGVKLPVAVEAMKGISNVAALSGANAEEASRAMYNLGQAIGAGAVKLQDWKSVELANMGTKEFKEQLIQAAIAAGSLKKGIDGAGITAKGKTVDFKTFNSTLAEGWLTSKALTDTLSNYADETTDIGKRAYAAATEVKTFSMMMETLRAAAGTGWTDTFDIVIGNLPEATKLWTGLTNAIGSYLNASANARNKILGDWKKLGGRTDLLEGLKNVFKALGSILKPIKDAFRDIFPAKTGKQLAAITKSFRDFTAKLAIGEKTADNLKRIFKGIFSIFSIVWTVIKGVARAFGKLFSAIGAAMSTGGGNLLDFSAHLGDVISGFDAFLKKTDFIGKALSAVGTAIGTVVGYLGSLVSALMSLGTGEDNAFLDGLRKRFAAAGPIIDEIRSKIQEFVGLIKGIFGGGMSDAGAPTEMLQTTENGIHAINASLLETKSWLDRIKEAWQAFVDGFHATSSGVGKGIGGIGDFIGKAWKKIKEVYSNIGLQDIMSLINTAFLISLIRTTKGFIKTFKEGFESVNETLGALKDTLKTFQKAIKAKALRDIAVALLMIAVALWILSKIDILHLVTGLTALGIMLKMLTITVEGFVKGAKKMKKGAAGKIIAMSVAMVLIGIALIAVAAALKIISSIPLPQLLDGMMTVGFIMAALVIMADMLDKTGGSKALVRASFALLILSFALMTLAGTLKIWDALDASTILDSIWKVALVLWGIGKAMKAFPKKGDLIKTALSILIVSVALNLIAFALRQIGDIGLWQLIKAFFALAAVFDIMVIAVKGMAKSKDGAASMLIAAAAIGVMALSLKLLASIPWTSLVKGIAAIAALFIVLGAAAYVLGPMSLVILTLSYAIGILGLGLLAMGAGMLAFSIGLVMLASLGAASIEALLQLLPILATQAALAFVAFVKVIGDSAPAIVHAFVQIITALINAARELLPQIPPLLLDMLDTFLTVMKEAVPRMADAALDWLVAILTTIQEHMYDLTTLGIEILIAFLQGITDNLDKIATTVVTMITTFAEKVTSRSNVKKMADAGVTALTNFLNGVMDAIEDPANKEKLRQVGTRMADMVKEGFKAALTHGLGGIVGAAINLATKSTEATEDAFGIASPSKVFYGIGKRVVQGLVNGLKDYSGDAEAAVTSTGEATILAMKKTMAQVSDIMAMDIDPNPVIAPVLDLTQFRKEAAKMTDQLKTPTLPANVSYDRASSIATDRQLAAQQMAMDTQIKPSESVIKFEQNNYSPKTLSAIDIYRQTRNQLSLAKGALTA